MEEILAIAAANFAPNVNIKMTEVVTVAEDVDATLAAVGGSAAIAVAVVVIIAAVILILTVVEAEDVVDFEFGFDTALEVGFEFEVEK